MFSASVTYKFLINIFLYNFLLTYFIILNKFFQ
nr:MAG TPA: hypothetical protein [Caudoviricetes sp.]